ncbi:hypothetical protein CHUAL_005167 [Chamberlinius hualienensis]
MFWRVLLITFLTFVIIDNIFVKPDYPVENKQRQVNSDANFYSDENINPRGANDYDSDDYDFESRDSSQVYIRKRSTDKDKKCKPHWSTRKCERTRHHSSSNSTYVTCKDHAHCSHHHYCCSVHNYNSNSTVKCCVHQRRHKKKHHHHQNTTKKDKTTISIS